MKSPTLPVFATALFLSAILLFAIKPNAAASAENEVDKAAAASKNWVTQIDSGLYDESYLFTCDEMHDKVTQERWVAVLKALRTPWGPVVSRKQISHIYKPNGVPGLEGECMVIVYDTSFSHMDSAREEVVLKWQNGTWRGAGYKAGPLQSQDDVPVTPPSDTATETETQNHVKPLPQQ